MALDLQAKLDDWRSKLLDLTKRNRLVNCKIGGNGALELLHPTAPLIWKQLVDENSPLTFAWKHQLVDVPPGQEQRKQSAAPAGQPAIVVDSPNAREDKVPLEDCLASPKLRQEHILTALTDDALSRRLKRLSLLAHTALDEQGVNVLFVGFGILEWYESVDSDIALTSPLLLVPLSMNRADAKSAWQLTAEEDEPIVNQCLYELLKSDFGLSLPELNDSSDGAQNPFEYFESIKELLQSQHFAKRWQVLPKVVLGTFSFQKVAMWQDLKANSAAIMSHRVCRAIAGEPYELGQHEGELPPATEFDDRIHPSSVHSILDNDSSQLAAILAARNGMDLVVDGPPGTGKSQTIANVIAECLAANKSVLFVSEKVAALEVVKRRLDEQKLGDFCLECHSHKANKKAVVAELRRTLELPAEDYRDQARLLNQLDVTRGKLNAYVRALHRRHGALAMTPFEAHGRLAALNTAPATRCRPESVQKLSDAELDRITEALDRLSTCSGVLVNHDRHPWRGTLCETQSLSLGDDIQQDFLELAEVLEGAEKSLEVLRAYQLCDQPATPANMPSTIAHTDSLLEYPMFPSAWFSMGASRLTIANSAYLDAEREIRRIEQSIDEFELLAIQAQPETLTRVTRHIEHPFLQRVRLGKTISLREYELRLESILAGLKRLRGEADSLTSLVDALSAQLTMRIAPESSLRVLHKLADIGAVVAQMGPLRELWFDDGSRTQLIEYETEYRTSYARCEQIRSELKSALDAIAFDEQAATICSQVIEFKGVMGIGLGMLSGRWRQFRSQVGDFYPVGPPWNPFVLSRQMALLSEYHSRLANLRRFEAKWRTSLVFDSSGHVDWDAVHNGIMAIDQLARIIKVPDRLKAALSADNLIDRPALRTATEAVSQRLAAIDTSVNLLKTEYSFDRVGPKQGAYQELSYRDFGGWLSEAESAIGDCLRDVKLVIQLLKANRDCPLNALSSKCKALSQLEQHRTTIERIRQDLRDIPGLSTGSLFEASGSLSRENMDALSRLQQFTAKYGECPPAHLVTAVTSKEARNSLSLALADLRERFQTRFPPLWEAMSKVFANDQSVSWGIVPNDTQLRVCAKWLRDLADQVHTTLPEWIEFQRIRRTLASHGCEELLEEVLRGQLTAESAPSAFLKRFYRSWLEHVYRLEPALEGFRSDDHETMLLSFRKMDTEFVRGTFKRIRASLLQHPDRPRLADIAAPSTSEVGILLRESNKRRRQLPLRQLFRRIPSVLQRLKPCVMMSPLAVSTFLDSQQIQFDVVIFDEASQVLPFDAVGAIYRGRQLVVAGDQKQLPPTSFFDRMDADDDDLSEEDDDTGSLSDFESILDVCCSLGMRQNRLRWHYRSRRESLIAFSNRFFYGNELVTFPSVLDVDGCSAVRLHYLPNGRWLPSKEGGYNPVEARETALLIAKHYEQHPDRSLGVITFNQRQQLAVQDELESLCSNRPGLEALFNDAESEKLFIKNLENVQGDERDHIILSIGYGFDAAGKFAMRFGPLNKKGGERRLNVAITRARYDLTLVSSIRAEHIDLAKTQSQGARLLRGYLDFADRGPQAIAGMVTESAGAENDSPFEYEVEQSLVQLGLSVRRQVGCSGFRIDLALVHPTQPGRYVLGIECDGATYHRSATARDRDRLRQEVLEGLQWTICRIWSTDWVRNPQRQIERILNAYQERLRVLDEASVDMSAGVPKSEHPTSVERPTLMPAPAIAGPKTSVYSNIDNVPELVLRQVITDLLIRFGQMSSDDVVRHCARQLGFQRAGKRIQTRIENAISSLARHGDVKQIDGGLLSAG